MSYVQSITGDPINPSPFSYSVLSISANTVLEWPSADTDTTTPATSWIDVTASVGGLGITAPDANQVGIGEEIVFNNYGSNSVSIVDADGNSITSISAGSTKRIWVVTNSTAAGTWRVANIGAGTSGADASALAGYGLKALANQLSQAMPTISYSVGTTLTTGVRAYLVIWTGGSGTFTLPTASSAGDDWFLGIKNAGSGTLTVASAQNVDGVASISVAPEVGFFVGCNGSTYYTVGKAGTSTNTLTQLNKSVAGGVDVTLTSTEAAYNIINLTGTISANINTIVPATLMEWIVFNNTSGSYSLTVKTPLGTGIAITQGTRNLLYCDGTNVQRQNATTSGTVTSIATGTGLTGGPITGSGTIAINNTAVAAGAYGAAMGVSSWTVNAQGQLTASSFTARSITGTVNEINVANGDGVSGAPTLSLSTTLVLTGKTLTGGTFSPTTLNTVDNAFSIKDNSDATKIAQFICDSITTATTRSYTFPDASGNLTVAASQSDQETGTSLVKGVTSGTQQYHPSAAKAWVAFDAAGTITASYNIASVVRNSTGNYTITFTTAFSSVNYVPLGTNGSIAGAGVPSLVWSTSLLSASTCRVIAQISGGAATNPERSFFAFFGDQ